MSSIINFKGRSIAFFWNIKGKGQNLFPEIKRNDLSLFQLELGISPTLLLLIISC